MSAKEAIMPVLTRSELERCSDAAGRLLAETDREGTPVADRHAARFAALMKQRARARTVMAVETRTGGAFVVPCTAMAYPVS